MNQQCAVHPPHLASIYTHKMSNPFPLKHLAANGAYQGVRDVPTTPIQSRYFPVSTIHCHFMGLLTFAREMREKNETCFVIV